MSAKKGVKPVWHIHPGYIGNRNLFSITTACENPKEVMKWVDKMYEFENSLQNEYGEIGTTLQKNEDGTYSWMEPTKDGESQSAFLQRNKIVSWSCWLPEETFGELVEETTSWKEQKENYALYEEYMDPETWTRPYYSVEEANRVAELTTDIFKLVNEKKAKWTTGAEDVNKDWESYIQSLKNLGIDELMEINQRAYDRYLANLAAAE